jgi:CDP-glycerol glycerophosphotransferase (TagB/SpsB family)
MDIYPVLRYADILIADYSSVYFDFLYIDKPIVFFCYDYTEWAQSEQGVVLDYFTHSPGDKCYTMDELFESLLANIYHDGYAGERALLLEKMFDNKTHMASELISSEIYTVM